jgi:hypothetical protein
MARGDDPEGPGKARAIDRGTEVDVTGQGRVRDVGRRHDGPCHGDEGRGRLVDDRQAEGLDERRVEG